MSVNKSSKNKTIELSNNEIVRLEKKLLSVNDQFTEEKTINKTILGDAFEIIDCLPIHFVDLLFVDPPYNMDKVFGKSSFKKMGNDDYETWVRSWLSIVVDKLKPNASIYVCGD